MTRGKPYPAAAPDRLVIDASAGGGGIRLDPERLARAVEAATRGDARAWDTLFERFHRDVHAYALARVGDPVGAEDVTQEVFEAAVKAIRSLRERREPAVQAWFLHICRHKVIDHQRRARRAGRRLPQDAAAAVDPAHVVETRLRADEVRLAMALLTEDQRDILVRRFVLDQSLDEVAAATRRSVGAVKSMQHRALATLERVLAARSAA